MLQFVWHEGKILGYLGGAAGTASSADKAA